MPKIVNIGIVAHVDAGKTTITEQLLYRSGALRKIGSVDSGTSQTDFLDIERQRGISVKSVCTSIQKNDVTINLIDTPGHVDFAAEVERSISVLDAAVLVISAVEGIQSQTELLYKALKDTKTVPVIFINKIDRSGSDVDAVLQAIRAQFTKNILLFTDYTGEGEKDCTVVMKTADNMQFKEQIIETVCEFDDQLAERYLNGEDIPAAECIKKLKQLILSGEVVPVLCGSSFFGVGIDPLFDFLAEYIEPVKNNTDDSLSGVVFKIEHDKAMGRIAYVRMFGGQLKTRDSVLVSGNDQKITQIRKYAGAKYSDTGLVGRGDVAALCGLSDAKVSDIIGEVSDLGRCKLATPLLKVKVKSNSDIHSVITAFTELSAEDPQLEMEYIPEEKELTISIIGKIQLEILTALVKERYGIDVTFSPPTVIYKETPLKKGNGFDAYTMPKPCWAVVSLDIEPGERGSGLQYKSVLSPKKMWYRYQNHVETSVPEALKQGLYNWEVTDLKVTLVDGEHHTIHTHPLDFFLCTPIAVMKGLQNCGTQLLEPMMYYRISAQEEAVGRVIGDIIAMRGEYDSPVIRNGQFTIETKLPVATSLDYGITLASITSGKGTVSARFGGYQPCPLELGAVAKRRGVNPLDREKWILHRRNALQL